MSFPSSWSVGRRLHARLETKDTKRCNLRVVECCDRRSEWWLKCEASGKDGWAGRELRGGDFERARLGLELDRWVTARETVGKSPLVIGF